MKTKVEKFKDYNINFKWSESSGYIPVSDDLLRAVGLPNCSAQLDKLCDFLHAFEFGEALKLISYFEDISVKSAQKRLIDFLLMDIGCRITWGEKVNVSDFFYIRDRILGLTEGIYNANTNLELIQKINELGFRIV